MLIFVNLLIVYPGISCCFGISERFFFTARGIRKTFIHDNAFFIDDTVTSIPIATYVIEFTTGKNGVAFVLYSHVDLLKRYRSKSSALTQCAINIFYLKGFLYL